MTLRSPESLHEFFSVLHGRVDVLFERAQFDPGQRVLLREVHAKAVRGCSVNPLADPLSLFYLVVRANERELDEQAQELAVFLHLYLSSLALFDDVQDDDLAHTAFAEIGPPIAINTAITLLFLALDALRRATELEPDVERRWRYLGILNETSLMAVAGQHCDLLGEQGATTPQEVLAMQQHKTSTPALLFQTAAVFAGCSTQDQERYKRVGENFALLAQLVDDVRDIYGKAESPDLATAKMTFPIACFLEQASGEQRDAFVRLRAELPLSIRPIRELLYGAGTIKRVAVQVERYRHEIHTLIAAVNDGSPHHRTLLFLVDGLAKMLYRPPRLEVSRNLFEPLTEWHMRVRSLAVHFSHTLAEFGAPPPPLLVPWHLPHWMYDPDSGVVHYPDIEGQPEETLSFQALLMAEPSLERVAAVANAQMPVVMAHELFHHWRDATGNLSERMWHEEYVANTLALAYCQQFEASGLERARQLCHDVLSQPQNVLTPRAVETLERLFDEEEASGDTSVGSGYGLNLHQMALVQLSMVQRLAQAPPDLAPCVRRYLTPRASRAA